MSASAGQGPLAGFTVLEATQMVSGPAIGRHAPKLDEHTDEVLAEIGLSANEIADLRAANVIGARRT